ncbi:hypothetical protein M430DRAFT_52448 [Amorphotheca resinae ATCC 22711]|uniref:BZIP domain-containing protein n=1 Tax=Amorphotheca resinae ATCC 22711 TaxID=857342 RepID=A0A2T3AX79_AMORE|nr:hypothetical protein M430DRAFT_52448 [Amorphotheca resinae ATCC 22711]PSS13284.1 hypothetical protein M430DRAFT_52448 [Amorphotheca resinae ATCC 22711]
MSPANSQQAACLDPLDALVDFSEYEPISYQSPLSPASKPRFPTRSVSSTPATLPSSTQPALTGPSHNYHLYQQQTGIPQGAVANTLAINATNVHLNNYGFGDAYLSGLGQSDEFVDFGTAPGRSGSFNPSDNDMEFDSPNAEPAFFFPESTPGFVDPSAIGPSMPVSNVLPTQSGNVGRLWPGMHQQQAALAKAQAQQKQQRQQIIQQQNAAGHLKQPQRSRASHSTNPLVEEKISQLLNSMRQSSATTEGDEAPTPSTTTLHAQRARKDEEEMDEDERLLASEEGKKLSSKERRQLRNKVSARAFRSRRKEYIGQLEGEIAAKVTENNDLRSQNRALMEENTRLTDLTRMLLSSPSFSGFLDTLAQNPAAQQQQQQPNPAPAQVQQSENRQVRKDINPYAAQQQVQQQQQHIGMAMVPEQNMDFSILNSDVNFSYQPQVFSVLSMPETIIDSEILSGKTSSFSPSLLSEDEKVELPVVQRAPVSAPAEIEMEAKAKEIEVQQHFSLVVRSQVSKDEAEAAMGRVNRLCESIERVADKLRTLTLNL